LQNINQTPEQIRLTQMIFLNYAIKIEARENPDSYFFFTKLDSKFPFFSLLFVSLRYLISIIYMLDDKKIKQLPAGSIQIPIPFKRLCYDSFGN